MLAERNAETTSGPVAVLLNGASERLVLEILASLSHEFPRLDGPGFKHAVSRLSSRMQPERAASVLTGFAILLSATAAAGRLPRVRAGRVRAANKDELFVVTLLAAVQRGDAGKAIEAAIALLDTCHVHSVVAAAKSLGKQLSEVGVVLTGVSEMTFQYVAGYPPVSDPLADDQSAPHPVGPPALHILRSA